MKLHDFYNMNFESLDKSKEFSIEEEQYKHYPGKSSGALKRWISNHYHSKPSCKTAARVKNDPDANNFYKKRASWYQNIHCKGMRQVMKEYEEYLELPDEVTHFIEKLQPSDIGSQQIGEFKIWYEGFGANSARFEQQHEMSHENGDFDQVYDNILQEFSNNEQGADPLTTGLAGTDEQPVMYAVFKSAVEENEIDQQINEALNRISFLNTKF